MTGPSTCQSWTVEVPSILTLLPGLASKRAIRLSSFTGELFRFVNSSSVTGPLSGRGLLQPVHSVKASTPAPSISAATAAGYL